jgi:hypothetical protein
LEDLDAEVGINSACETIRENIKTSAKESLGYFELKKHKPWFDEERSELLDRWKEAKLQWLQDPSEINGDNMDSVTREASKWWEVLRMACRRVANKLFENLLQFKYLATTITNQNLIQEEIKRRLRCGKACYRSVKPSVFPSVAKECQSENVQYYV